MARDPRAAEAARLQRMAAGEQKALASGGVVLGARPAGLPTDEELLRLAGANMADQAEEIERLRQMGATMAGIVATLTELIVANQEGFERRPDGSYDVLLDAERLREVRGFQVTYAQQDNGTLALTIAPPAAEAPSEPPTDGHAVGQASWPVGHPDHPNG